MIVHHDELKHSHPFFSKRPNRFAQVEKSESSRWLMLHPHNSVLTVFHVLGLPDLDSALIHQTDTLKIVVKEEWKFT